MVPLVCIVVTAFALSLGVLVYVNWTQARELSEVRTQNERLIARIGVDSGFETRPIVYRPNAVPQPPIGPVPQPMWTFKRDT